MSRNGVRVVDLTARLGGLALQQISAAWSRDAVRQAVSLGDLSGVPVIDWVRPPFPNDDLQAPGGPVALIVILGPGFVQRAVELVQRAWSAAVPSVRVLLLPGAIVEDLTLTPMVTADRSSTRLLRLPDSSADALWFVLIEELNRLSAQLTIPPPLMRTP